MCRYAVRFLAVNGVGSLTAALGLARPPFAVIRYALAALEALTRACGPAGCEVALGWWAPPAAQLADGQPASAEKVLQGPAKEVRHMLYRGYINPAHGRNVLGGLP
jgi:hypothetical protein